MSRFALLLLLLVPSAVFAQSSVVEEVTSTYAAPRWQIGVGVAVRDSPYVGEDTRVRPLPWFSYEGERWFWRGLSGGFHLLEREGVSLDLLASGRMDGFDIDDLDRRQLARNGLNPAALEDRDDGLDLGAALSWRGRAGELKLQALTDVSDASDGYELALDYGYTWTLGRTLLIPGVGLSWLSKDTVRYYYGTLDAEEARGVPGYRPDAALVPKLQLGVVRPLNQQWRVFGAVSYRFLPSEISDSPFLESDSDGYASLAIGIARSF